MEVDTALALNIISDVLNDKYDSNAVQKASRSLASHADLHGLTEKNLNLVADVIRCGKLSGSATVQLMRCLIPENRMPNEVLTKILAWVFTKIGTLGSTLERLVFCWLADLLQHDLCNKNIIQKYYYNFLYALSNHRHLEVHACVVLCSVSQKHDAKPFIVKPLIARYQRGSFAQLGSLLAILKGFRDDVVPLSLGHCPLHRPHSSYHSGMQNAVDRVSSGALLKKRQSSLVSRTFRPTQTQWAKKPRLIPAVEYARQRSSFIIHGPPAVTTPTPLQHRVTVTTPVQTMSLLANKGGFLTLLAADSVHQGRLLNNLEATLNKVFLVESDEYSDNEKTFLFVSMAALQEYLNYSLSIVSKFLIKFLLMWDGLEYSQHIHSLIEWLTFDSIEEWESLASILRVHFRCCDIGAACALLSSLKMMLRNMVAGNIARNADVPSPIGDERDTPIFSQLYMAVGKFIGEMVVERISCARKTNDHILVTHALYFYNEATSMETEGDLCAFILVPFPLVYNVLFSNHRTNIHHLSQLLLSYNEQSERLRRLGIFEEFETQLQNDLGTYLMDFYRALFTNLAFRPDLNPGAFTAEFQQRTSHLAPLEGFSFKNKANVAWWFPSTVSSLDHFPCIRAVQKFIETKLADLDRE